MKSLPRWRFFFSKNLPSGSNSQPIANLYHGLWSSTEHEHFEPKREGMEDYFPLQTMSLVLYFHILPAIFEWFAPKHPGRVWWNVKFVRFLVRCLVREAKKIWTAQGNTLAFGRGIFWCSDGVSLTSQPRHPRRRTRWKWGCGKDLGTILCMWEMSDFFWSEKISLDDSFDQSKKTTWNQEKLCFKPSWAVDGWQLRTGPQFFLKLIFVASIGWMCETSIGWMFETLHRWDVQVVRFSPDSARKMRRTRTWKRQALRNDGRVLWADLWGRFLYLSKHLKQI